MHHPLGLFNDACTITSVPIMAVPLYYLQRAVKKVLQGGGRDKAELLLMSTTLTALCISNLILHATGYIGPPCTDTFGCVHNVMLSALLYKIWYRRRSRISTKRDSGINFSCPTPESVTMGMIAISCLLLGAGLVNIQLEQIATNAVALPAGAYVVCTMGRMSWSVKKENSKCLSSSHPCPLKIWQAACVLLFSLLFFGEMERWLCHLGPFFSRFYHSIFLHVIVSGLFWCVTGCAFCLDEIEESVSQKRKIR